MIRLFTVLLVVFIHSETSAQVPANIQRRCETILVDADDAGNQPDYLAIRRLRYVPLERIETRLRKALQAEDVSVRLVAADVCWLLAPGRFRDAIVQSMNEMEGQTPVETVRQTIMIMKMGDLKAKKTIQAWVKHDLPSIMKKTRACPMECVLPKPKDEECAVCAMEIVDVLSEFTEDDWQARIEAIRAYQQLGNRVTDIARSIIISEASSTVRLQAAIIWGTEDLERALPHIQIFLQSNHREFAFGWLSRSLPESFVEEFERVVHDPESSSFARFECYNGLLQAGKSEYLEELRKMIGSGGEIGLRNPDKDNAVMLMVDHAEHEDVALLVRLLDTEYRVVAAEALLTLARKGSVSGGH